MQYIEYIILWVLVLNRWTTWIHSCLMSRWKSQLIHVKLPTIGAEFHEQIRSLSPIIQTLHHRGLLGLTIDRCIFTVLAYTLCLTVYSGSRSEQGKKLLLAERVCVSQELPNELEVFQLLRDLRQHEQWNNWGSRNRAVGTCKEPDLLFFQTHRI